MNINKVHRLRHVYFRVIPNALILIGIIILLLPFILVLKDEAWYYLKTIKSQKYVINSSSAQKDSVFARYLSTKPVSLNPVNTSFSIIIEKIGVNAPIVADVSVTNTKDYIEALKYGIAHANTSNYPSKAPGNTYLFAHTSLGFWNLGKYATVFNLLHKLEAKDRIHVFYNNNVFVYEVVGKEVLNGWNTYPLVRPVIEPLITLQTCDPPGTTINRLVVTAKLVDTYSYKL